MCKGAQGPGVWLVFCSPLVYSGRWLVCCCHLALCAAQQEGLRSADVPVPLLVREASKSSTVVHATMANTKLPDINQRQRGGVDQLPTEKVQYQECLLEICQASNQHLRHKP